MRPAASIVLMVLFAAVVALSGCIHHGCGVPRIDPDAVPADAPSTASVGDAVVQVLVRDPGLGAPVDGAPVVIYWDVLNITERKERINATLQQKGEDSMTEQDRLPERAHAVLLRTGADGRALAMVPGDRDVHVATRADGFAMEWRLGGGVTQTTLPTEVVLDLYRSEVELSLQGRWTESSVSTRPLPPGAVPRDYVWQPMRVPFHEDGDVSAGYGMRLTGLSIRLDWTNALPAGSADFGIGLGTHPDELIYVINDHQELTTLGPHVEEGELNWHDLAQAELLMPGVLYVGPLTERAVVAGTGIPFTIHLRALVDPAIVHEEACGVHWGDIPVTVLDPSGEAATGAPADPSGGMPVFDPAANASAPWWLLIAAMAAATVLWRRRSAT